MDILKATEATEADRQTTQNLGIPSRVLMENAGRAVAGAMQEHFPELRNDSIAIICGKGGNGGDGLVLLRTLAGQGYNVQCIIVAPESKLAPDTVSNLQCAKKLNLPVKFITTEKSWSETLSTLSSASIIVDAILGTGLTRSLDGLMKHIVDDLNKLPAQKVAIDIPSGLISDSGHISGTGLKVNLTIALSAPKACHYISPGSEYCGVIEIAEIGIAPKFLVPRSPRISVIEPTNLIGTWPKRSSSAHKGQFGHLLIVAGSIGKTGAALLVAEAALRSGAGLVTVASAKSAIPMMAPHFPEAMWIPLPETSRGTIGVGGISLIDEISAGKDAIAVGPGLSTDPDTLDFVGHLLSHCTLPIVIDADGVRGINTSQQHTHFNNFAITPHPGEAGHLLGIDSTAVQAKRLETIRELASKTNAHILLKGHHTLISDPGGNIQVNLTGNSGLATAGTGDALTGIIGGLLVQRTDINDSLVLAAHVHGLAGDLAAAELGEASMTTSDVIQKLPTSILSLDLT